MHKARLYPFDNYKLTSSLRVTRVPVANDSDSNATEPRVEDALKISRVLAQGLTSSFDIETSDMESFLQSPASAEAASPSQSSSSTSTSTSPASSISTPSSSYTSPSTSTATPAPERRAESGLSSALSPQTPFPSRDFDMHITRPPAAQMFVVLMFALSWVLVHVSVTMAFLARRTGRDVLPKAYEANLELRAIDRGSRAEATRLMGYTFLSVAVLGAILGVRKSMPDAPGLDGILLDCAGFFPQVIIAGLCILALLFTIAARELDSLGAPAQGLDSEPYPSSHCHCARGLDEPSCTGRRGTHPFNEHTATDSEGSSDSSATTSPEHIQYARRYPHSTHHSPTHCRQSLISAFPPPPGFRRSQSLSSPFSPSTSTSPSSPTPVSPGVPSRGGASRPCNNNAHAHGCTSSNGSGGSSSSAGAELGHWHFPSTSTHSLPVSPTRIPGELERSRVMSPSPKLPRSPLAPLDSSGALSPIGFAMGSPTSPTSPASPTSPTTSIGGRKKFAFALGSVFGGSPSPPASPNSKLGFSLGMSNPGGLKRGSPRSRGGEGTGTLGLGRKKSRGAVSGDVELELRRSVKRRESGVGHRRVRTASVTREGEEEREVSRWSDHEDD